MKRHWGRRIYVWRHPDGVSIVLGRYPWLWRDRVVEFTTDTPPPKPAEAP